MVTATPHLDRHAILYFGNDWFAENRTSSHHIARRLGARYPLLYVEVPGLRAPKASGRDLSKAARKLINSLRPPAAIGPRLWHLTLPQIPFRNLPGAGALNRCAADVLLQRAVRRLQFSQVITWFHVPHPGFLAGKCGESLSVYYAIDNYSALPDVDGAQIQRLDDELSRRAGLVFASSAALAQAKRALNGNVVFSPHGVDTELFAQAFDSSRPCATAIASIPRPIIGFFGVLDSRIDPALLTFLATSRPSWSFVLVGRIATQLSEMAALPNVILPGCVPYETLPDWARAFDVCLMPYRQDAFSAFANPLKMREYLATGRPVVSVPMPEAENFGTGVAIARDYGQFLTEIEKALAFDSPARRIERQSSVMGMTWDARVEEIVEHLERELARRTGRKTRRDG